MKEVDSKLIVGLMCAVMVVKDDADGIQTHANEDNGLNVAPWTARPQRLPCNRHDATQYTNLMFDFHPVGLVTNKDSSQYIIKNLRSKSSYHPLIPYHICTCI